MARIDQLIDAVARGQDNVISRGQVLAVGGSDELIANRIVRGLWQPLQAGVYLVGSAPPTWAQQLRAAVAAAGPDAFVSHRAALVRWGLSGITAAPVEISAPHGDRPAPEGVVLHRSRRAEATVELGGIRTASVERALLEAGSVCPLIVVEKATASAIRLGLTSETKIDAYLLGHAGKGRRGVTKLRDAVDLFRDGGGTAGSDGEVAFLHELHRHGVPAPVRQLRIDLRQGARPRSTSRGPPSGRPSSSSAGRRTPTRGRMTTTRGAKTASGKPGGISAASLPTPSGRARKPSPPRSSAFWGGICVPDTQIHPQNDEGQRPRYVALVPAASLLRRLERCRPSSTNSTAEAMAPGDSLPASAATEGRRAGMPSSTFT